MILLPVFLTAVYLYTSSQPFAKKENSSSKSSAFISKRPDKKMAPGAACCKASFSRMQMIAGGSAHSAVTPAGK